jgi:hypothetical protein
MPEDDLWNLFGQAAGTPTMSMPELMGFASTDMPELMNSIIKTEEDA